MLPQQFLLKSCVFNNNSWATLLIKFVANSARKCPKSSFLHFTAPRVAAKYNGFFAGSVRPHSSVVSSAPISSNPKHVIYAFSIFIIEIVIDIGMRKGRKRGKYYPILKKYIVLSICDGTVTRSGNCDLIRCHSTLLQRDRIYLEDIDTRRCTTVSQTVQWSPRWNPDRQIIIKLVCNKKPWK